MQIAVERVFDELAVALAVGHVIGAEALRCRSLQGRHGEIQPPQQPPEVAVGQQLLRLGDDDVDVCGLAVPPQRQVDHDLPPDAGRAEMPGDRPRQLWQLHQRRVRG